MTTARLARLFPQAMMTLTVCTLLASAAPLEAQNPNPANPTPPAAQAGAQQPQQNPTPPPVPNAQPGGNPLLTGAPPVGSPPPGGVPAGVPPAGPPPGAKTDVIRERYPNGAVQVERHVVQDAKGNFINHGPWTAFYPDGKKIGGGPMVTGKKHGPWSRWFSPGEGMFGSEFYAEYEGPFTSEAVFVGGQLDGVWVVLDKNKTRINEWHFSGGKQNGPWIWRWPGGQLRREMVFVNGVIDGEVVEHGPDGKLISKEVYIAGHKKELKTGLYGPNVKQWEGWYLHGPEKTKTNYDWWYGHAETVSQGYAAPPVKHGHWVWWHPNGQKWVEGDYVEGKQSGPWTWWTPEGQVEKQTAFAVVETKLVPTVQPGPPPAEPTAAGGPQPAPAGQPQPAPAGQPQPQPGAPVQPGAASPAPAGN